MKDPDRRAPSPWQGWLRRWCFVVAFVWTPASSSAAPARPQDRFEELRAEAAVELVQGLEALAEWCSAEKLFAERDLVFQKVLHFDPAHFDAHRGLGHSRLRDGTWVVPDDRLPPKNYGKDRLPEARRRLVETLAPFRGRVLAWLDDPELGVARARRNEMYAELLLLDPEDVEVRALVGEVKRDGRWVPMELARVAGRRIELAKLRERCLASAPAPAPFAPDPWEAELVDWHVALRTPWVRALFSAPSPDAERVVRIAHAAQSFFRGALGAPTKLQPGFTLYVLPDLEHKDQFLERYPGLPPATRAFLERLVGSGLPDTANGVWWDPDPERRIDGLARHVVAQLMVREYRVVPEHGWVWDGFGRYLVFQLTGTRRTWFVQPSRYEKDYSDSLEKRLAALDEDWLGETSDVLLGERRPRLPFLLRRDINAMTIEDSLYAYVLASYLLEAWPVQTGQLLRQIGAGVPSHEAIEATLDFDLYKLESRALCYLEDMQAE